MAAGRRRRLLFACKMGPSFLLQLIVACIGWTAFINANIETDVNNCASLSGFELCEMITFVSYMKQIKESFEDAGARVQKKNGMKMVLEMSGDIERMMAWKVQAVQRISDTAEESMMGYPFDDHLTFSYNNAKQLNKTLNLTEDPHFYRMEVNTSNSSVHVPTNVYDQAPEVLNAIKWSENINPIFQSNYRLDPSLSWQYFGSSTGFMRQFPAIEWPQGQLDTNGCPVADTYDCRMRPWYIEAATHPKDMVILIDNSGSMTGMRKEIAKHVVLNILDTLNDDDYFAIYNFTDEVRPVVDCFNQTLVPANMENLREYKNHLQHMKTENVANFTKALESAFELLRDCHENGSQCNQAIMIITDGAPQKEESVFQRYNWPDRRVRVFTYLIGQEMSDVKEVQWMACSNRGFYSHVSTLAEAREQVQNYIPVMARPLVLHQKRNIIWTSVYADIDDPKLADWLWEQREKKFQKEKNQNDIKNYYRDQDYQSDDSTAEIVNTIKNETNERSYRLMTTVAYPVFDRSNKTKRIAHILGVAGTDVPIEEITKLATPFKLGVNGYSFAITNNGYILFHPDLRPIENGILKPDYNSVDLVEVELLNGSTFRDYNKTLLSLRNRMINSEVDQTTMPVMIHLDDMKRVVIRNQHYYFSPLKDTPFSFAIVMPDLYGIHEVEGQIDLAKYRFNNKTGDYKYEEIDRNWTVHPDWVYCRYRYNNTNRPKLSPEDTLLDFLKQIPYKNFTWGGNPRVKRPPNLDDYSYNKANSINRNEAYCDHELLQSLVFDANATKKFDKQIRSTDKRVTSALWCQVTVSFIATRSGLTRYEAFDAEKANEFIRNNNRAVDEIWYKRAVDYHYVDNASFVFSVPFDAYLKNDSLVTASHAIFVTDHKHHKRSAAVAVVGVQFKHSHLKQRLENMTACHLNCLSNDVDCYLLDDSGFIIVDKNSEHVGKFYGEVKGNIMEELVNNGTFNRIQMFDYQAVCVQNKSPSGSASILFTPFTQLKYALSWLWYKAVMLYFQYSFGSWWHGTAASFSDVYDDSINQTENRLNTMKGLPSPCDKKFFLYKLNGNKFKHVKPLSANWPKDCKGQECCGSYIAQMVTRTNLMLLRVNKTRDCDTKIITLKHSVPSETLDPDYKCKLLKTNIYRKRPKQCVKYHEGEVEGECGRGALTHLPSTIVMMVTVVTCIVFRYLCISPAL